MLAFEETRHATAATVVIESFDEKEVIFNEKGILVDSSQFCWCVCGGTLLLCTIFLLIIAVYDKTTGQEVVPM